MKVAIGLSGGVDSSVAAKILKDEGHDVIGLFLKLWSDPLCKIKGENRCCDQDALEDARRVAQKSDIPFYVINARDEFKKEIVDNFLEEYKNLRTPNPCVICNEKVKFDLMLNKALALGCEKLATGHYARIENARISKNQFPITNEISNSNIQKNKQYNNKTIYQLFTGIDSSKDQSYMLYRLNQKQLSYVMLPLGEMTKKEVRAKAVEWDMPVKEKPESQEICFFGDRDYRDFLKRYLSKDFFKPGDIVTSDGNVVGEHEGLVNYTIGQRRGISQEIPNKKDVTTRTGHGTNINSNVISTEVEKSLRNKNVQRPICLPVGKVSNEMSKSKKNCHSELVSESQRSRNKFGMTFEKEPLYVVGFNAKKNQLIVGDDEEIYKSEMTVGNLNWINKPKNPSTLEPKHLKIKIRYRHEAVACEIEYNNLSSRKDKPKVSLRGGENTEKNNITIQQYDSIRVIFDKPQRAITPGQSAVFYLGDEVLGGGIIL